MNNGPEIIDETNATNVGAEQDLGHTMTIEGTKEIGGMGIRGYVGGRTTLTMQLLGLGPPEGGGC